MSKKAWNRLKQVGSDHYKGQGDEPIDLMKDNGILWNFAIGNIIKYAFRNKHRPDARTIEDLDKIIHYCRMLKVIAKEETAQNEKGRTLMRTL